MTSVRQKLKKIPFFKLGAVVLAVFKNKHGLIEKTKGLWSFLSDYARYKKMKSNPRFPLKMENLYPRVFDKTPDTPLDPVYFYQDTWFARKIFEEKPEHHYDVGSNAKTVGLVSQFAPSTMIDIRPLPLPLVGLFFIRGDITKLPFRDNELSSLSSICVIEHAGLGRYGDPLDPFGSEKAARELARVLARGGNLYVSVPVDKENTLYYNAHRAFTREYLLELFSPLKLIEERYIYGNRFLEKYDPGQGFGTGLYHFRKI